MSLTTEKWIIYGPPGALPGPCGGRNLAGTLTLQFHDGVRSSVETGLNTKGNLEITLV